MEYQIGVSPRNMVAQPWPIEAMLDIATDFESFCQGDTYLSESMGDTYSLLLIEAMSSFF